jgi:PKD repeat protein
VSFDVYTYDPCALLPIVQTVVNQQGTVNEATITFAICANGGGCNNEVQITASNDSTLGANGVWTFTATPTGTAPFTYDWWVDGASYSTQTLTHTFNGGIVGVYVTVTDANGCDAFIGDTLFLDGNQNGCSAAISVNEDSLNNVLNAELWAVASGVAPFTYTWSTGETTESIYLQDIIGLDTICVSITDATGCTSTSCEVVGFVPNQVCAANFWYQPSNPNSPIYAGDAVGFNYSGSISQFNYYFWTVQGVGLSLNSFDQNPSFTFPAAGTYEVCVEVYDSLANCADTYCETIIVLTSNSGACEAEFTWMESNILGSPLPAIEFTDQSSDAAYWYWDFGDNTFSTDQNPLHTYNSAGWYLVCLTIVNSDQSCQQTYCDTIVVGNPNTGGCNAAFSSSGPTPIGYTFSANVQDQNLYYYWEIDGAYVGDGFEALAPGLSNGVHTICLTIIDSLVGCSDTQCQTITVGSPNCYGYISGQLYAGSNNQPLDEGVVYLITFDPNTNMLTAVDSMVVDSGNYYFFGPLACGDYLIKAAAYAGSQYYNDHVPTYYGNSPFWGFAQTVSIAQANTQVAADVFLIAANNPGGPGFIGGDVTQGANKMDEGDPLAGMQVMLFDLNGNAIAYTYTNGNGEFGFENLPYGIYQVYVEVLGVQTIPALVEIGPNEPSVDDVHILASETLITTGIEEFDFEGAISDVYPNPASDVVAINFNLENEAEVNINILDLSGRTISTQPAVVGMGESSIRLSAEGLNNGYYFLNIQDVDGAFSVTRKFMRVD